MREAMATINGVKLTKEQLEDGLKQIAKNSYVPAPGDYFKWCDAGRDEPYPTVYFAVTSPQTLIKNPEEHQLLCVDKMGNLTHFGTSIASLTFVKVSDFNE